MIVGEQCRNHHKGARVKSDRKVKHKSKITNGGKDEEKNKAAVAAAQFFDVKHFLNLAMAALSDFVEVVSEELNGVDMSVLQGE
jgi:hypothetical protein